MATQFSGGTYVSTTFTGATKQNIIDNIETQLLAAGWTTISGHSTTNLLMQSATQSNVTNPIRVRIKDNAGTCVQVSIENQAGTVIGGNSTTAGGNLLPAAAKTFRIIATKFHFLCFTPGASAAQEFVMAGMLYVPTVLTSITDHGYMFCNSKSDASTSQCSSFRTGPSLTSQSTSGGPGNSQVIWNTNILENANNTTPQVGNPEVVIPDTGGNSNNTQIRGYRWKNDDINTGDVLVSCGLTAQTDEGKIAGWFYDMLYIGDAFAVDATDTFSSHTWWNLTNNWTGINNAPPPRGGIWVATS